MWSIEETSWKNYGESMTVTNRVELKYEMSIDEKRVSRSVLTLPRVLAETGGLIIFLSILAQGLTSFIGGKSPQNYISGMLYKGTNESDNLEQGELEVTECLPCLKICCSTRKDKLLS